SRRPTTSRLPSSPLPEAAPGTFEEDAATSEKRTTSPMGAELRAPRTRTERAVQRGEQVDRFEEQPTGAKPIARITKPGAAAPPPIPSAKRTMIGVPVTPGPQPHGEDTGTGEVTRERLDTDTTRDDPTRHDPFGPAAQPTLTFPDSG